MSPCYSCPGQHRWRSWRCITEYIHKHFPPPGSIFPPSPPNPLQYPTLLFSQNSHGSRSACGRKLNRFGFCDAFLRWSGVCADLGRCMTHRTIPANGIKPVAKPSVFPMCIFTATPLRCKEGKTKNTGILEESSMYMSWTLAESMPEPTQAAVHPGESPHLICGMLPCPVPLCTQNSCQSLRQRKECHLLKHCPALTNTNTSDSSLGCIWPFFLPFAPNRVPPVAPSGATVPYRFAGGSWEIIKPPRRGTRLELLCQSSLAKTTEQELAVFGECFSHIYLQK